MELAMRINSALGRVGPFLEIALLLGVAAGCGDEGKLPSLPADEVIKKASAAIQAPNSFHFNLSTENMHTLPGLWLTRADGDAVKPDKMKGKVTARNSGVTFTSDIVVDGSSQYWTVPVVGGWAPMPPYFNISQLFNPARGAAD